MKATDWKRVVRPLIPADEHWEFRGSLCYRAPAGRFLFGVLGEGSGFDKGVYIWRVSMPLFVPSEVMVLSFSERVGGGSKKYDDADIDELSTAIGGGLRDLPTEDGELRRVVKLAIGSPNLRLLEAAAYSYVLLGDQDGAVVTIEQARRSPTRFDWEGVVVDRLSDLAKRLNEQGIDAAAREVDAQAKCTAAALGLTHE